jgi:hypothetical protein
MTRAWAEGQGSTTQTGSMLLYTTRVAIMMICMTIYDDHLQCMQHAPSSCTWLSIHTATSPATQTAVDVRCIHPNQHSSVQHTQHAQPARLPYHSPLKHACPSQHQQHNSTGSNSRPQPQAPSRTNACRALHSNPRLGTIRTRWRSIPSSAVPAVGCCALLLWQGLGVRGRGSFLGWCSSAVLGGLVPAGWHLHWHLA